MLNLCKEFLNAANDFANKATQGLEFTTEKAAEFVIRAQAAGAQLIGGVVEPVRNELDRLYTGITPQQPQPIPIRNDI